ncbi:MAG: ABC transporter permease subunit [Rubrobacteraceae bacterium]
MIAKELREAWWKLAAATAVVFVAILTMPILTPYEEIVRAYDSSLGRLEISVLELFGLYTAGGFFVLVPLAALLGGTLVSSEVSGNTIYLLLSRPTRRRRLLLHKYAVCAGLLLVAAVSGDVLVIVLASANGYPLGFLTLTGLVFSAGLMWLGSLFVLGVGLLFSIILRSVLGSVVATALAAYAFYALPLAVIELLSYTRAYFMNSNFVSPDYELAFRLTLFNYWSDESLFAGESFVLPHFAICIVAATLPLLAALWLFGRKAY